MKSLEHKIIHLESELFKLAKARTMLDLRTQETRKVLRDLYKQTASGSIVSHFGNTDSNYLIQNFLHFDTAAEGGCISQTSAVTPLRGATND